MDENWKPIKEFPNYRISDIGRVLNHDTGKLLKLSLTKQGAVKVGLVKDGVQHTRAVSVLVADTFVKGRSEIFNTPIHLDGNQENNTTSNLQWRPRWFAWKYTKQFEVLEDYRDRGQIQNIDTGEIYWDAVDLVTRHGLLLSDVWRCIRTGDPIFPTNQVLTVVVSRK